MYKAQHSLDAVSSRDLGTYTYKLLSLMGFMILLSSSVHANPFATTGTLSAGTCPADHRMYYVGETTSGKTLFEPLDLNTWSPKAISQTFTFSNNTEFKISFDFLEPATMGPTFFKDDSSVSPNTNSIKNALLIQQYSTTKNPNHKVLGSINKPISKFGFVIQDIDYNMNNRYKETFSIVSPGGVLSNIDTSKLDSTGTQTVTAKNNQNCSISTPCNVNADWGYHPANTSIIAEHGNVHPSAPNKPTTGMTHVVGYSAFYFCLAPPKLIVKKVLNSTRFNVNDQFEIKVTGGKVVNTFTTEGTGATINNGSSSVINLDESTSYKITESVVNGTIGNIANYNATYKCSNVTTSSNTAMPSGTINSTGNTRSFDLINPQYGDEITCTITNTPKDYTFSGTVFNDNGGLSGKTSDDKNGTFISNTKYFNGKLDTGEAGISGTTYPDLKVSLTNCAGTNIGNTTAQTVSDTGKYSFTVPSSALNGINEVCMVQTKPNPWAYTVDTTPNKLQKTLANDVYNYDNLNFGKVITDQTALVLKKYQYVHQCAANLSYTATTINGPDISSPSNGFSTNNASDVKPGQCIAYKIEAYNHGHIALTNIRITDILQKTPVKSRFHLPVAADIPATLRKTDDPTSALINIGDNGVIITAPFELNNTTATTSASKATLYFNTKYGTSVEGK